MRNLLLVAFILLAGCSGEKKPVSSRDAEFARCICKVNGDKELRVVRRVSDTRIELACRDGSQWVHEDSDYTEGCSNR